ncbi:hypothetical protein BaRGS_00014097, partial [Batillaria attramentaria]
MRVGKIGAADNSLSVSLRKRMSATNDENSVPGVQVKDKISGVGPLSPASVLKLSSKANILKSSSPNPVEKKAGVESTDRDKNCPVIADDIADRENSDNALASSPPENADVTPGTR